MKKLPLFLAFVVTPILSEENRGNHDLIVIHTGTQVIDAHPYYARITKKEESAKRAMVNTNPPAKMPATPFNGPVLARSFFPFRTSMKSGAPVQIEMDRLYKPFFIIGMDDYSLNWLFDNAEPLKQIGAFGLVVQAESWKDWLDVKGEAQQLGITLTLQQGEPLSQMYKISTYPALVIGK